MNTAENSQANSMSATIQVASKSRILWIDIFRGMGILLVVIGHSSIPDKLAWWIWSFHMPMFFFISGYLLQPTSKIAIKDFVSRRVRTLVIPYIFFSAILMMALPLLKDYVKMSVEISNMNDAFHVILFGWRGIALWFIPVLLLTELTYVILGKLLGKTTFLRLTILGFAIAGYILSLSDIHLAYKLEVVPTALAFFSIGVYCKNRLPTTLTDSTYQPYQILIIAVSLVLNFLACYSNSTRLDMCFNELGTVYLSYLAALCGILAAVFLSLRLSSSNGYVQGFFLYFGKNSLIILGIHQLIKIGLSGNVPLSSTPVVGALFKQLLLWSLLVISIFVFNRYFYYFLGKSKVSKQG